MRTHRSGLAGVLRSFTRFQAPPRPGGGAALAPACREAARAVVEAMEVRQLLSGTYFGISGQAASAEGARSFDAASCTRPSS